MIYFYEIEDNVGDIDYLLCNTYCDNELEELYNLYENGLWSYFCELEDTCDFDLSFLDNIDCLGSVEKFLRNNIKSYDNLYELMHMGLYSFLDLYCEQNNYLLENVRYKNIKGE